MPVPAGAGTIRRCTGAPEWSPTPSQLTTVRIVCSFANSFVMNRLNDQELTASVAKRPQCALFSTHPGKVLQHSNHEGIDTSSPKQEVSIRVKAASPFVKGDRR